MASAFTSTFCHTCQMPLTRAKSWHVQMIEDSSDDDDDYDEEDDDCASHDEKLKEEEPILMHVARCTDSLLCRVPVPRGGSEVRRVVKPITAATKCSVAYEAYCHQCALGRIQQGMKEMEENKAMRQYEDERDRRDRADGNANPTTPRVTDCKTCETCMGGAGYCLRVK